MSSEFTDFNELARRIKRLEDQLDKLSESSQAARYYSVAEFANEVRRATYTVREWARLGRIQAVRRATGRGPYRDWVISHVELLRYQQHGLLPAFPMADAARGTG